jgi:single-strand DNA-binding protein
MPTFQRIEILGHVGSEPKLVTFPSGDKILSFSVATSEFAGKDDNGGIKYEPEWFNIRLANRGDFDRVQQAVDRVHKGTLVMLDGHFRTRKITGQDGHSSSFAEVRVGPMFMILDKPTRNEEDF